MLDNPAMEEKHPFQGCDDAHQGQTRLFSPVTSHSPVSRSRRKAILLLPIILLLWIFPKYVSYRNREIVTSPNDKMLWVHSMEDLQPLVNNSALVPLEAHIMSKCPDAKDCLRDLVVPAMEKVVDIVDFRLSFIGS